MIKIEYKFIFRFLITSSHLKSSPSTYPLPLPLAPVFCLLPRVLLAFLWAAAASRRAVSAASAALTSAEKRTSVIYNTYIYGMG